ncbi:MAG TPA: zf-HC2 domain-containing protein [Candidatus Binatia bacterium]|nr:zf-HC2 domain-containing protein [Candidatus Binatia bacterium]
MAQRDKSVAVACKQFEEDLVLYYYGELETNERAAVKEHVQACEPCRLHLKELESILPLTLKPDEPPQAFWDNYTQEMRRKLSVAREGKPGWWSSLESFLKPWAIPLSATAAVALLALTLTFGKGFWGPKEVPQEDEAFMEILPAAENMEFFKTMDVLDAMDFLEYMGSPVNDSV